MSRRRERRHVARLMVPSVLRGAGSEDQEVWLVDLSREGACIEHFRPIPDWRMWFLTLPPALSGVRLHGEVLWSRAAGRMPSAKGERQVYYQSGMAFRYLTPEQQAGLATALEVLKAAQEG